MIEQKIAELSHELATINENRDRLNFEAKRWAEKRNILHEQIKSLRVEVNKLKEKRDKLNDQVKELKDLREHAKTELMTRNGQLSESKKKLETLLERIPRKNIREIKKKIKGFEWEIQTTHLTLKEEKSLIDRVKLLEAQLLVHNQLLKLKNNHVKLKAEREALGLNAKLYHKQLSEFAEQSQSFHENMLEILNKIQAFQSEADSAHQKHVQMKQEVKDFNKKHIKLSHQITTLKQKLHQVEEEKQNKRKLEISKDLEETALDKFRRGEKLTWEEFKILAEKKVLES